MTNYRGPPIWRRNLDVRPSAWPRFPTRKQSWVVWIKYKRNEFTRLTSSVTSESYHHARVSVPSLGHFETRQKGNDQNSPDGFLLPTFDATNSKGKDLPAKKRLHLGTQETLWKALDLSLAQNKSGFSLTELIFSHVDLIEKIFTSALIIDWAETPKTANLRSRAPAESKEWSTPRGIQEVNWRPPNDSVEFQPANQLNQANQVNQKVKNHLPKNQWIIWIDSSFKWVGRVPLFLVCTLWTGFACLSVENPGGLCLAPSASHRKTAHEEEYRFQCFSQGINWDERIQEHEDITKPSENGHQDT